MILVTGGTGFIGQVLIHQLVAMGKPVRSLLRPSSTSPNLPRGVSLDVAVSSLRDERGLRSAMKGIEVVYHLASAERKGSRADLTGVDIEGTQAVIRAAVEAGVEQIIYLSHLGANRSSAFPVLKAKAIAENYILRSGLKYTIFRSAVVFGPNDQFTESLARLIRMLPGLFLMPGDGSVMLQPIWVEDLVTCMALVLDDSRAVNQVYEVGGAEYFNFRQIIEVISSAIGERRYLVPVIPTYLRNIAVYAENLVPNFPISLFWLDYLATDRTCALDTLPRQFGLIPTRFTHSLDYLREEFGKPTRRSR